MPTQFYKGHPHGMFEFHAFNDFFRPRVQFTCIESSNDEKIAKQSWFSPKQKLVVTYTHYKTKGFVEVIVSSQNTPPNERDEISLIKYLRKGAKKVHKP